jgi:hypothetical protein
MTFHLIYDNSERPTPLVEASIGIEDFGQLIFRRRTLRESMRLAVRDAGVDRLIEINSDADWAAFAAHQIEADENEDLFLICPSRTVSGNPPEAVALFLRQARHAPGNLLLQPANGGVRSSWLLLSAGLFRDYAQRRSAGDAAAFIQQHEDQFLRVSERLSLIDLNDEGALLKFLSGGFDVRFFNSITHDEYTVTKFSTDREKLAREFRFYGLLPPASQMFFVQPFDFQDDGVRASYRMERLGVPDMALQWVHGALSQVEFERFLDRVFHFVALRPSRRGEPGEMERAAQSLYVDKVEERIGRLKALPQYPRVAALLANVCGDIDQLTSRYLGLFERERRRMRAGELVIGHGDLCFSNILYSKTSQLMKLIDPRGASSEPEMFVEPLYDLAKLSHSVLGSYDLINQDMFDLEVDEELGLRLVLDRQPPPWARPLFVERLNRIGFDPVLVRLCEASLFISMLPLHIDRPRKVVAFVVNAVAILDEVEANL